MFKIFLRQSHHKFGDSSASRSAMSKRKKNDYPRCVFHTRNASFGLTWKNRRWFSLAVSEAVDICLTSWRWRTKREESKCTCLAEQARKYWIQTGIGGIISKLSAHLQLDGDMSWSHLEGSDHLGIDWSNRPVEDFQTKLRDNTLRTIRQRRAFWVRQIPWQDRWRGQSYEPNAVVSEQSKQPLDL